MPMLGCRSVLWLTRTTSVRWWQHLPKRLETLAQRIVDHCFAAIRAAKPSILVEAVDGDHSVDVSAEVERMFATALKDEVEVAGSKFALTHIQVTSPEVAAHRLAFLANRREVRSDNLGSSIPQLKSKLADPDGRGFWWLTLVESHTLDEAVNSARDSFSFPEEPLELFPDRLSMSLLRREVVPVVLQRLGGYLEPIKERAEQRVGFSQSTGTKDNIIYSAEDPISGSVSGKPNSQAFTAEVSYTPFGKSTSYSSTFMNLRLSVLYTHYFRFNGGYHNYDGFLRNAYGNDSVYLNGWLAF